jgi:hypothetical protein
MNAPQQNSMRGGAWWLVAFVTDIRGCRRTMSSSRQYLSSIQDYLQETMDAIFMDPSSYSLSINEGHRKPMMRALLGGIPKVDFDAQLRDLSTRLAWDQTQRFVVEELVHMTPPPDAPEFAQGLKTYQLFQDKPSKLFSYLARGRMYQGKFERLLQDVQPGLLPRYQDISREIPRLELLRSFANEQTNESSLKDELLQCVDMQVPKAAPQPLDGGKSSGTQNEIDLSSYLQGRLENERTRTLAPSGQRRLLAPVFIQTRRRGNGKNGNSHHPNKKHPYIIELPESIDLNGKTTELDALVVEETTCGGMMRIHEVWEAKATLHPITLYDALSKKSKMIACIFEADSEASLWIHGTRYTILLPTTTTTTTRSSKLGIFGKTMMSPAAAARRTQLVAGERLLETSRGAVQEALATGQVSIPRDQVMHQLERLLQLAQDIQPMLVVSSELGSGSSSSSSSIGEEEDLLSSD